MDAGLIVMDLVCAAEFPAKSVIVRFTVYEPGSLYR